MDLEFKFNIDELNIKYDEFDIYPHLLYKKYKITLEENIKKFKKKNFNYKYKFSYNNTIFYVLSNKKIKSIKLNNLVLIVSNNNILDNSEEIIENLNTEKINQYYINPTDTIKYYSTNNIETKLFELWKKYLNNKEIEFTSKGRGRGRSRGHGRSRGRGRSIYITEDGLTTRIRDEYKYKSWKDTIIKETRDLHRILDSEYEIIKNDYNKYLEFMKKVYKQAYNKKKKDT